MSPESRHEVILEALFEGPKGLRATADTGQEATSALDLPPLRRKTIELFKTRLDDNQIAVREELEVLGWNLYEALINGDIRTFIKDRREEARKKNQRLRLLLRFSDTLDNLASYPWEFLFDPETQDFFSTWVDMVLSRYQAPPDARQPISPEESPLKILLVISKPTGLDT